MTNTSISLDEEMERESKLVTSLELMIKEANEKIAALQSRLSAVEAERDGLRAELAKEKRLRAELKDIAQAGISEVGSVGATLKENAVIDFRSRTIALCRAKADEHQEIAKLRTKNLNETGAALEQARADAARQLATELEQLQ